MKRRIALLLSLILAASLAGCGVSQEVYQSEYVHARDLEAKNEDLVERLGAQTSAREAAEGELAAKKQEAARLVDELEKTRQSRDEINGRLETCQTNVQTLRSDLDLARKAARTGAQEQEQVQAELRAAGAEFEGEKQKWEDEREVLERQVEDLRSRIIVLEADRAVLEEQKEKAEREKQEKLDQVSKTYEGLLENMKDEVEQGRVTISQLQGQLSVKLLDEILFPSGSAQVKEEGREVLRRVGEALSESDDKMIIIEGHTDNVPIRGTLAERFATNWELSTARAVSVVRYLVESAGIDPTHIAAEGYGEHRPVSENETPDGRARNRRIEIKLVPYEPPVPVQTEANASEQEPSQE